MTGSSVHRDKEVSRGQIEAAGPGVEADKHEDSEARIDAPGGHSCHLLGQTVTWSDGAIPENVKREENKSKPLIKRLYLIPLLLQTVAMAGSREESPVTTTIFFPCLYPGYTTFWRA